MANITMWATKSSSYTDAMVAGKPTSYTTSETTIISSEDAAKIRKDAEDAIRNDEKKELLYDSNGIVYGWAEGNTIHLTSRGINPNTPVHEY